MREIKFRAWDKELKKMLVWEDIEAWSMFWLNRKDRTDYIFQQFTGLKDKNGKEIYEGDILKHEVYGKRGQVLWEDGGFRCQGDDLDTYLGHDALKRTKIIGNIYENPELLK